MTTKQIAILAVLSLSVIGVFCDLAFRLVGGAVPGPETPTLQFEQATHIPQVATGAPVVPPMILIDTPAPDELEPQEPEKLTPPTPLPEKLPPSHDLKNLYTPLPGEGGSQ